jgi:hypothetical protein
MSTESLASDIRKCIEVILHRGNEAISKRAHNCIFNRSTYRHTHVGTFKISSAIFDDLKQIKVFQWHRRFQLKLHHLPIWVQYMKQVSVRMSSINVSLKLVNPRFRWFIFKPKSQFGKKLESLGRLEKCIEILEAWRSMFEKRENFFRLISTLFCQVKRGFVDRWKIVPLK